jgi:hypothetical protein
MTEQLGIISDIHIGVRDLNKTICWFNVDILYGTSLQIISIEEISKILTDNHIYKLDDLNSKPCIVEVDINLCKFKRLK